MTTIKIGDKVKMSMELQLSFIRNHSKEHVDEFKDSIGIVESIDEYNEAKVVWDNQLRYTYSIELLEKIDIHYYLTYPIYRAIALLFPMTILFLLLGYGYYNHVFYSYTLYPYFIESYFATVLWLLTAVLTVQYSDRVRRDMKDIREEFIRNKYKKV